MAKKDSRKSDNTLTDSPFLKGTYTSRQYDVDHAIQSSSFGKNIPQIRRNFVFVEVQDWQSAFNTLKGASEWMGGRAVEGTGLENQQACKRLVGSNPTPSATKEGPLRGLFFCQIPVLQIRQSMYCLQTGRHQRSDLPQTG